MNPSDIYFVAANAAEQALPVESRALIAAYDLQNRAYADARCPWPPPAEYTKAQEAVDADPLANAAMELRRLGNRTWAAESTPKR